jgi:hypothetical protein
MNRAAAWRVSTPAVRYDYAPRSWDNHPRFLVGDLARKETLVPLARKLLKLAAVTVFGVAAAYATFNCRVQYLGDGTLRLEDRGGWFSFGGASVASPSLSTVGWVARTPSIELNGPSAAPAPGSRPGPVDAAPANGRQSQEAKACSGNRQALAAAVAAYNKKFPSTRLRSLANAALLAGDFGGTLPSCPAQGEYSLALKGSEALVKCSAH